MTARRSRAAQWLVVCGALALGSGCFDLVEEIWLEAGGGGRMKLEIVLPKSLLGLGRMGGEDLLVSVREDAANAKTELAKDPDIRRFDYRTEEEPGSFKLVYEVESNDASKLPAAQARALAVLEKKARGDGGSRTGPVTFEVRRKLGLGFELQGAVAGAADKSGSQMGDDLGKAMAGAMLGGHTVTVRLHAPVILSSNGTIDPTRSMVEWKVPLSALAEPGFKQELNAQALSVDWKVAVALAVVAVLLVGMVLGRLTSRRR
jgi:hypothetical protein